MAPDRIGRIHGAAGMPFTAGVVCAKVARYAERVHHPDRLERPLLRVGPKGSGQFRQIPWDEALDRVADAFAGAMNLYGSQTLWPYHYAGTMGLVQRDGIKRFRHVLKTSRQQETICTALADAGWLAGVGKKRGTDSREMADSDLVVMWGGNPVNTQVNVMTLIARARKERGAKLVVVDPYRTGTAEKADLHLMLRPGTDGALACAVMHVLFKEGFADRDYMAKHTDCPERLEAHLATRTPAWASGITGLPAEQIVEFARLYGATKRSFLRLGYGFTRSRNGAANMHAVSCLPAVTGAWAHPGGGALYSGGQVFSLDRSLIEAHEAIDPTTRILDMCQIGDVLTGDAQALRGGPPVTAMLIQNCNPMTVAPESLKVRQGFARDDLFVCVHEQFMTETAKMADIVLPATTFLEHDDIYTSGGHSFLQVAKAVLPPRGEARSNHEVLGVLAARLGFSHRAWSMTAWEIIDATLRSSGLPSAEEIHARRWLDCQLGFETAHFLDGFEQPDGRFRFAPDWAAIGPDHAVMPPLPDHLANIDGGDLARPYRLVTAPARNFLNSTFTETPTSRRLEVRPTALIHPADCAALHVAEGDAVRLGNQRGSVVVHARPFDGVQRGVVVVEGIWPDPAFSEGVGINALTGSDPAPPRGGGAFHDTAVWIRPA